MRMGSWAGRGMGPVTWEVGRACRTWDRTAGHQKVLVKERTDLVVGNLGPRMDGGLSRGGRDGYPYCTETVSNMKVQHGKLSPPNAHSKFDAHCATYFEQALRRLVAIS